MPFLVRNIRLGLDEPEERVVAEAAERLHASPARVRTYAVVRRALDARKRSLCFCYQVELALDEPLTRQRARLRRLKKGSAVWIEPEAPVSPRPGVHSLPERPTVIGFGPAGMFAALRLAEHGYRPIVLERGRPVRARNRDVLQRFYRERVFDESSNLLFGEGGAGTYSDGKLYTRVNDPLGRCVLETFYRHGADPDILVDSRPHIGSDRLPTICTRIRKRIEGLGGEILFEQRLDDVRIADGRMSAIRATKKGMDSPDGWRTVGPTILAIGHSARDTIRMLHGRGVSLVARPFQIGVRIEHPQAMIDRWQYGDAMGHGRLGPAEYHLVARQAAGESTDLFSFCMCPGGMILPTNESAGLIATNGASRANRSGPFGNSGLVITVDPTSSYGPDGRSPAGDDEDAPLALRAMDYLEQWERKAFEATDRSYRVPSQRAVDFLRERPSDGRLETSYPLGGSWTDIRTVVPASVANALRRALPALDGKFPGFAGREAVITAPETRASAPVRIPRDPNTRQAVQTANLYPVGEGAGYAGGIVSAAIDGIKTADTIMAHYAPPR